jgi:hypothetical protein
MKLINIIDSALLNSGGLNTHVPEVRQNIIKHIVNNMCNDNAFTNLLDDGDCDTKDPYADSPIFAVLAENQAQSVVTQDREENFIKQPEPSPIQPKIGNGKNVKSGVTKTNKKVNKRTSVKKISNKPINKKRNK